MRLFNFMLALSLLASTSLGAAADDKPVRNPPTPCCKSAIRLVKPAEAKAPADVDPALLEPRRITRCDLYAGHPWDPFGRAVGRIGYVHRAAAEACKADAKRYPGSLRIRYQNLRFAYIADPSSEAVRAGLQDLADRGYVMAGITRSSLSQEPAERKDAAVDQILAGRPLGADAYGRWGEGFIKDGRIERVSATGFCNVLRRAADAGDPESMRTLEATFYTATCPAGRTLYSDIGTIEFRLLSNGDRSTLEFVRMPDNSDPETAIRKVLQEKLAETTDYRGPTGGAWTPKYVSEIDRLFAGHPYTLTDADLALR